MIGTRTACYEAPRLAARGVRVLCTLAVAAAVAAAGWAGELKVDPAAKAQGQFGLEAITGIGCAAADVVVGPGAVSGTHTGCSTITTDPSGGGTQVVDPGAEFVTGQQIKFDNRFSVVDTTFEGRINTAIATPFVFVVDESPDAAKNYWAIYRINLDPLTLALGEDIGQFVGFRSTGPAEFRVVLRRNAAPPENRLAIQARDNVAGGLVEFPEEITVPPGYNFVNVWWRTGNGDGQFMVSINGEPSIGFVNLENGVGRLDEVQLGFVDGLSATTTGSFYLDDFASFRTLAP